MFIITDYGAVSGGEVLCTKAIQSAVDACAEAGGGTVVVPAGLFLTGTVFLKSNVELHLENGATLKASSDLNDYNNDSLDPVRDTDYPQNMVCVPEEWRGKHVIVAHDQENVSITGNGCIDASADSFFEDVWFAENRHYFYYPEGWCWSKDKKNLRPGQVIVFAECKHVTIRDITVTNAPCWDILLHGCDYVQVRGIYVYNPRPFINTDGIDIDCCSYVTVSDCVIDTGDDCITVRANPDPLTDKTRKSQYIAISNCSLSSTCFAFRIGVGQGDIEHVTVSNISVSRAACAIALTTNWNRDFTTGIRDVNFSNITAAQTSYPLLIAAGVHKDISEITIENYRSYSYGQSLVYGEEAGHVHDITLRNIEFFFVKEEGRDYNESYIAQRGENIIQFSKVDNITLDNFKVHCDPELLKEFKKVFDIEDSYDFNMNNVILPPRSTEKK